MQRLSRRTVLGILSAGTLSTLAGCSESSLRETTAATAPDTPPLCEAETYPLVRIAVVVETVKSTADGWRFETRLETDFEYGRSGVGPTGAVIAAYDQDRTRLATEPIGDIRWSDVTESNKTTFVIECEPGNPTYANGSTTRRADLSTATIPRWLTVQFRRAGAGVVVTGSHYTGSPSVTDPDSELYEQAHPPGWLDDKTQLKRQPAQDRTSSNSILTKTTESRANRTPHSQ